MSGNGAAAGYGDMLVTSLLVLGVVCVIAFLAVRLLGRVLATGRARGAHLMDVVARVPLEPRRSLYVVEVAGKTLLVGTSEMGLSVLSELDATEVRSRVAARPTFADLVKTAWAKRKGLAATAPGGHASSRDTDVTSAPGTSNRVNGDGVLDDSEHHARERDASGGDNAARSDANEASAIR